MTEERESRARLREAFAALDDGRAEGTECPVTQRILDSVDEKLAPGENRKLVRHLAECGSCSAAWGLARELTLEHGAEESEGRSALSTGSHRRWLPLAVAAAVILTLGLVGYRLFPRGEAPAEPVYRVDEESWLTSELLAGQPLPRQDCLLRWTAGPEGTTFDLQVTDEDLEILAEAWRLSVPEYRIDPGALAGLSPGSSVLWRVIAYLPDGRRASSRTFVTPLGPPR
jgi:hypothetical protein